MPSVAESIPSPLNLGVGTCGRVIIPCDGLPGADNQFCVPSNFPHLSQNWIYKFDPQQYDPVTKTVISSIPYNDSASVTDLQARVDAGLAANHKLKECCLEECLSDVAEKIKASFM